MHPSESVLQKGPKLLDWKIAQDQDMPLDIKILFLSLLSSGQPGTVDSL